MNLVLAPHNDDEALWCSFTICRGNAFVVVVLRSQVQQDRGYGITATQREAETDAAMKIIGADWEQWPFLDSDPDWDQIEAALRTMTGFDRVYAPAIEENGHAQHNRVGELADKVFGEKVAHYMTYTPAGKSVSEHPVPVEPGWMERKMEALQCYKTQIAHPSTAPHFTRDQTEYYAPD